VIQIFLFILILLLPVSSEAAYNIYLKNGSVISRVKTYEKKGGEVTIYIGGGSMTISEKDILKIEGTETIEEELSPKETIETKEKPSKQAGAALPPAPADDKSARVNALKADLAAVYSEIRNAEAEEIRLTTTINEMKGKRFSYNHYQLKQLEKETEPLQQELFTIQQKKTELIEKKNALEDELRALQ
jgi:chromosome segregation ATPase